MLELPPAPKGSTDAFERVFRNFLCLQRSSFRWILYLIFSASEYDGQKIPEYDGQKVPELSNCLETEDIAMVFSHNGF